MQTFLSEIANRIQREHPTNLNQVTIVFNNRRSGLFLRRQFAQMDNNSFFLPHIIGMDQFIHDLGNLEIIPNEFLLFELFDIHRKIDSSEHRLENFDEFISFGDLMLNDFSEIDLYCVNAQTLFSNLHDIKSIGEWDIETGRLTPFQEKYLAFYKALYTYYSQLHERLLAKHQAYGGMAYRYVAENIDILSKSDTRFLYFVGFNALSTSEEKIISYYIKRGYGQYLPDGDPYYYNNLEQEAGHFLRKHFPLSNTPTPFENHFTQNHKEITIVSCPENIAQCKYTGDLIAKQLNNESNDTIEQTAIILADESLLLPTLNALPKEISNANVTMGYPFTSTSCNSLILKLFYLYQHAQNNKFYHHDISDILTDPLISQTLIPHHTYKQYEQTIINEHIVYTDFDFINQHLKILGSDITPIDFIFSKPSPTPDEFIAITTQIAEFLHTNISSNNKKEREALSCLTEIIQYFQELQQQYHYIDSIDTLLKIYLRLSQKISVPFYGEPLLGLQILGVLETRNLDFKRVILLSANEGILPSGKTPNTLIPYNLKCAFGIPTFHEKDAVYAYNFYRLIQRAEEVFILYSTESDGMGKGEHSRFIQQIRDELSKTYPNNIKIHEEVLSSTNHLPQTSLPDTFQKTPAIIQQLHKIAQLGFSPSALNKYRNCPLEYYYENVLHLQEVEDNTENIEQNELGTYIHNILQNVYSLDSDCNIRINTLQQAINDIDNLLTQTINNYFQHGRSHLGRNHLLESIAKTQVTNFLQDEIKRIENGHTIRILGLEKKLERPLTIEVNGLTETVKITGIADRIDLCDGLIRVIDYKSGKVKEADVKVQKSDPTPHDIPDKWFQLMQYSWLYRPYANNDEPLVSGIFPLGNLHSELLEAQWDKTRLMTDQQIANFELMLKKIIEEILNPQIPFIANHASGSCSYCPLKEICK